MDRNVSTLKQLSSIPRLLYLRWRWPKPVTPTTKEKKQNSAKVYIRFWPLRSCAVTPQDPISQKSDAKNKKPKKMLIISSSSSSSTSSDESDSITSDEID